MEFFNKLQEIFKTSSEGYMDKLKLDTLYSNKLNAGIIAYILIIMVFRPYKARELANKPYVQLFMTGIIIYVYRTSRYTAALLTVAFLSSITLENDTVHNRNIPNMPIQNRETFQGNGDNDSDDDSDDDSNDAIVDNISDSGVDSDDDSDNDSDDDSDNDDNSNDEIIDNTSESAKKTKMENFNMAELFPKNSLNDTFKDLHVAIHKLENFVNSDVQ